MNERRHGGEIRHVADGETDAPARLLPATTVAMLSHWPVLLVECGDTVHAAGELELNRAVARYQGQHR